MDCGCRVIKKRKRKSLKRKLLIVAVLLAAIVTAVCVFITRNVNPMIVTISNEKIRSITADAVSRAVLDVMSAHGDAELMTVIRDEKSMIKSVDIDTAAVSELAQEITINAAALRCLQVSDLISTSRYTLSARRKRA